MGGGGIKIIFPVSKYRGGGGGTLKLVSGPTRYTEPSFNVPPGGGLKLGEVTCNWPLAPPPPPRLAETSLNVPPPPGMLKGGYAGTATPVKVVGCLQRPQNHKVFNPKVGLMFGKQCKQWH